MNTAASNSAGTNGGVDSDVALTLHCSFQTSLSGPRTAWEKVEQFLIREKLAPAEIEAWKLVLIEAGNNAVEHCPATRRHETIDLWITCAADGVEARLADHTDGLDWDNAGTLPSDESENGRGIFLIKSLCDHSTYFRGSGQNILHLHRRRRSSQRAASVAVRITEQADILERMTEELGYAYESLVAIFRHSNQLGQTPELREFATQLLTDLTRLTEADGVVLRLLAEDGTTLSGYLSLPISIDDTPGLPAESVSGVEPEAIRSRQDVWFGIERELSASDPLRSHPGMRIGLVHPLTFEGRLLGTLSIGRKEGSTHFGTGQVSLLHTFADFLGIQINNLRMLGERVNSRVLRREIEIAAELQRSLLPQEIPEFLPFDIAGVADSAREVGGDFFDVIPAGDHGVLLVIADVMGKGLPAALFATVIRSVVRATNHFISSPGQMMSRINDLLYDDFARVEMIATAQLVYLTRHARTITMASAGHCPLIYAGDGLQNGVLLDEGGIPLGVQRHHQYKDYSVKLPGSARILMYTDGVSELRNCAGETFGEKRLAAWLSQAKAPANSTILLRKSLSAVLTGFSQGRGATDDQTFLLISERTPSP